MEPDGDDAITEVMEMMEPYGNDGADGGGDGAPRDDGS